MEALNQGANTLFILLGGIMVLAMHAGFAFLELGTVRQKNQVNALVKILVDFSVSTVVYFVVGYGVAYGTHFMVGADVLAQKNGYDLVKTADGHAYVVVSYADHAKDRGMANLKELIGVNPEYFTERLQNTWGQNSLEATRAIQGAIGVLEGYPAKQTVSMLYDGNPEFSKALSTIFGEGFEYPDFSYRTVSTVLKMANAKLEKEHAPTDQHKVADTPKVDILIRGTTSPVVAVDKLKADVSLGAASTDYIDVDACVKLPDASEYLQRMYVATNDLTKLVRDVPRFAANETSVFDDGDSVECPTPVLLAFNEAVPQVMALIEERSNAMRTFERSRLEAQEMAFQAKGSYQEVDPQVDQTLTGPVLGISDAHVVLSLGRSAAIVAQRDIDSIPAQGASLMLVFKSGKGAVTSHVSERVQAGPGR